MRCHFRWLHVAACAFALTAAPAALASTALTPDPGALAKAMAGKRVVLGEVHDNAAQHALRVAALSDLVARGARPALAFEQFDRERQADIDRARRERPRDADYVIAQGKGAPGWHWEFYRPFVQLALDYDLPIVAANLSRAEAMQVAMSDAPAEPANVAPGVLRGQEEAIRSGHCDLLPAEALPGMVRAQVARDRALAAAIRPYIARGVVLLTGNGHARIDIGVPYWLAPDERAASVSIGMLERDEDGAAAETPSQFDAYVLTDRAQRADPCDELRRQMHPAKSG